MGAPAPPLPLLVDGVRCVLVRWSVFTRGANATVVSTVRRSASRLRPLTDSCVCAFSIHCLVQSAALHQRNKTFAHRLCAEISGTPPRAMQAAAAATTAQPRRQGD